MCYFHLRKGALIWQCQCNRLALIISATQLTFTTDGAQLAGKT